MPLSQCYSSNSVFGWPGLYTNYRTGIHVMLLTFIVGIHCQRSTMAHADIEGCGFMIPTLLIVK